MHFKSSTCLIFINLLIIIQIHPNATKNIKEQTCLTYRFSTELKQKVVASYKTEFS